MDFRNECPNTFVFNSVYSLNITYSLRPRQMQNLQTVLVKKRFVAVAQNSENIFRWEAR